MDMIAQFELMSDAAQLALLGAGLWVLAGVFTLMERRRARARDLAKLEAVGWVPWTTLFVLAAMLGAGLLAMALPAVLKG
jgi:ABC-type Na+ efflux pump permease subunit